MALSEDLTKLAARAKETEGRAAAAGSKAKAEVEVEVASAREAARAQREELRRRLTQSEKLVALGQFVAGIAHELNNPLQGVLGHLELLGCRLGRGKPVLELVARLGQRARKRMLRVARHPGEDLGGHRHGAELSGQSGRSAQTGRSTGCEHPADGRARDQRVGCNGILRSPVDQAADRTDRGERSGQRSG